MSEIFFEENNKNNNFPQSNAINKTLADNRKYLEKVFYDKENFDFIIRDFTINFKNGSLPAFIVFYDGLVNQTLINRDIMRGISQNSVDMPKSDILKDVVFKQLITLAPLSCETDFDKIIEMITFGNCAVFAEGISCAFVADVKGWERRGIDTPENEPSLSGPQEAFNEVIMTNLALIRKILKDPSLVAENIKVGSVSQTPCALMYIKGVTNPKFVDEVRRRLKLIDTDYIFSSTDIELLIEDKTFSPLTRTLKTQRPDRAASMLAEGKVVIIVQGSPYVLVLPTTAADLIEASEDNYVRVPEANFMRLIRILGMMLSVFLPGIFLSVMLFHTEILPTDLLLAIEATREEVPFPLLIELILMELSFELIKEASVRVPGAVGSTVGIIGGLILGQSAVEANIVSPISIIVVSVAGLGAFAAPTPSMSRSLAFLRFIFIIFGGLGGVLGFVGIYLILIAHLAGYSSFGVPFLSPFAPRDKDSPLEKILVKPIWKKEKRPENLNTQNPVRQPHISRKWIK